ncbi:MAG: HAMP domain-containing protein [Methanofollis liminatans]|jgi:methyl-accepting chemotaxis protein|uniref:histidine kinase n=3 Tax=Methanofollis TaxID=81416 RepID=A0A7K4HLP2_9EURY|nr:MULTISPECIES: HAMP domain-containing protein [Methanofollis]EJG06983.1 histidine kinase HAMP region domain protein [Methanofollis liminatans DSM 4140]MDD3110745.1 HAMP domain-containing protein [Methanofollis liminatans]NVO66196.1 HAMP domain-containing protein [Methanofollis tationis]HDS63001.1 HAMP domain-containing protein [Methanofollis liminatans]
MDGMARTGTAERSLTLQIPIFYKLFVSMLFVAVIPIALIGLMAAGDTGGIVSSIGLPATIFLLTLVTLSIVVMWSFFLASSITSPITQLSEVARSVSMGDLKNSEVHVMTNDEIGDLASSFNRMINSYKILDALSREEGE